VIRPVHRTFLIGLVLLLMAVAVVAADSHSTTTGSSGTGDHGGPGTSDHNDSSHDGPGGRVFSPTPAQAREAQADRDNETNHSGPRIGEFSSPVLPESSTAAMPAIENVTGDWVAFAWDGAHVYNYTVGGDTLFTVSFPGSPNASAGRPQMSGAQVHVETANFELVAHDNPTSGLKVESALNPLVTFNRGVNATLAPQGFLVVSWSNGTARLFGPAAFKEQNGSWSGPKELQFLVDQPVAPSDPLRSAIVQAAANHAVGAEISVSAQSDRADVQTYGNVSAQILARPTNGSHRLSIGVVGFGGDGRVIVIDLDQQSFPGANASRLQVLLDNLAVPQATDLSALLAGSTNGTTNGAYRVLYDPGSGDFQLVLALPHYSAHEIDIQSLVEEAPPEVWAGALAAGVVIVACGAALFVRRPQ
jgi:hypothetical protein